MMAEKQGKFNMRRGFTLIELLVVIGIIAMLIGVLVPGMHAVSKRAKSLKQKAQIHSLEVAVELFKKNHGTLPESTAVQDVQTNKWVCGAQHLAEALVGRDERGFDPESTWHETDESGNEDLYQNGQDDNGRRSLNRRYPPSFELNDSVAIQVDELYDNYDAAEVHYSGQEWGSAPVLTDTFDIKRITYNDEKVKVGNPILYYKANRSSNRFLSDASGVTDPSEFNNWIYNYNDNSWLLAMGQQDSAVAYPPADKNKHKLDPVKFYEMLANPASRYDKPFNPNTYILWSAGYDGVFGTNDDVTNFDR